MMRKALAVLTALASTFMLSACGGSQGTSTVSKTLAGRWSQTNSISSGIRMEAEVMSDSIQINMQTHDDNAIYWAGSFDASKGMAKPFKLVSLADPDAMKWGIFASQDNAKEFTYENGVLSYKFSMLGTTSTVNLSKE